MKCTTACSLAKLHGHTAGQCGEVTRVVEDVNQILLHLVMHGPT